MKPSVEELRYQCRIDSDDDTEDGKRRLSTVWQILKFLRG